MKKKINVKEIPDNKTKVPVNCPEHRIFEIKEEIHGCFECKNHDCKAEILDIWESNEK